MKRQDIPAPGASRRGVGRTGWMPVIGFLALVVAAAACGPPDPPDQQEDTGQEQQPQQQQPQQQQQQSQNSQTGGSNGLTGSATTQLALRSGPLPDCQSLGAWAPGQLFTVLARVENPDGSGTWYKVVNNEGRVAYAFAGANAENVNVQGDASTLPTESNFTCRSAQAAGGQSGGQASNQSGSQTTGGQTTGQTSSQTTGGQTGGQTSGGQTTGGQTTGGQTSGGQTTGGQTTGGQLSGGQGCGAVDANGCTEYDYDDCTYEIECEDLCGNFTVVENGTWYQTDNAQDICYGGDGGGVQNCGAFDDGGCDPEDWVTCDLNGQQGTMKVQTCYDLCDNPEVVVWEECGLG